MQTKTQTLIMIGAVSVGLGIGWLLPAQQQAAATGPQWKDRAEFDTYTEYTQAKDSKGRLAVLEKWSKGYADSELWELRDNFYLGVYGDMKNTRAAYDRAKQMRTKKPEAYFALITVLNGLGQLNPRTDADYTTAVEVADYVLGNEAKVFAAGNKPETYKDDQWAKEKPAVQRAARQIKIYVLQQQKKTPELEALLTQYLKEDPTQAQYNVMLAPIFYGRRQQNTAMYIPAIFHFTRAGVYTGPNALPAANAKTASTSGQTAYKSYHGSMEGYDKVVEVAKNNALPPADFNIVSIIDISKANAAGVQAWNDAHPELIFWRENVQIPLTGASAASAFSSQLEGFGLPPGPPATPFSLFTAKIVSMTPEANPKELVVEMSDLADPNDVKATLNAKLILDPPLSGTMPIDSEIKFKGTVKAYQASPLQVTFDVDADNEGKLEGWSSPWPPVGKQSKGGVSKQTKSGAGKQAAKQTKGKGK